MHSSTPNKTNATDPDEFKYGFPSDGLSNVSYKWWGNNKNIDSSSDTKQKNDKDTEERNQRVEEDAANVSSTNDEVSLCATTSLTALRKKAAEEGRRALKLGVHQRYESKNLDRTRSNVLMKIFKTSLPGDWSNVSSES